MSTPLRYWLVRHYRAGGLNKPAGASLDSTTATRIASDGGFVVPQGTPAIDAAAALAAQRRSEGAAFEALDLIMLAGVCSSTYAGGSSRVVTVTADYVAQPGDSLIRVDTTAGDVHVTMPPVGECTARKVSLDGHFMRFLGLDALSGDVDTATPGAAVTTKGNGSAAEVFT